MRSSRFLYSKVPVKMWNKSRCETTNSTSLGLYCLLNSNSSTVGFQLNLRWNPSVHTNAERQSFQDTFFPWARLWTHIFQHTGVLVKIFRAEDYKLKIIFYSVKNRNCLIRLLKVLNKMQLYTLKIMLQLLLSLYWFFSRW